VDLYSNLANAVRNPTFSTAGVPTATRLAEPTEAVFPYIHTPYDYYEKISF
jgi:hypothetical protein